MNEIDIRAVVLEELGNIAPEIDMAAVNTSADLREELDIDSMDFLNFVTALDKRLGINVPELDYPKIMSVDGAVAYLEARHTGS